ncbi:IclR family transcriptional regulator [Pectobacterium aroidearum]|uniref:IclR family transcriptional regulator n=1 Tax=Pectobacterium aroidearum TaxID=1201031 RepID=A0AAW3SNG8_9GAMM|nr:MULTISPECIES: IclR family transcriptional regulator [Pectobacterium]MBA5199883.1 IclR family transcriptional regulator [Pectobacterium aroidearum]MBA5202606.1 IclR family transcriptional regulator [Pectobacterium aroidearum]MBA5228125.1 IclR family transcriptional regulator [Pectobacterium aroidearum]MBA5232675.1 IclR family transcriptional regulator [Pectobacterium aroidearum]MBA5236782.1 IclR family transcriptional regulator [Pectobacterium aroidearum]
MAGKNDASSAVNASAEGGAAAVDRAFGILSVFDNDAPFLTLAEIARRTGFYKSTILRLLSSLEKAGFVRKSLDGRYSIGPEALRLSSLYQSSFHLRDILMPHLEHLSMVSGETSSFYIKDNDWRVILYRVEPQRAVRVSVREGDRFSLNYGASGKVLSAFSEGENPQLERIREQFWAESFGERDAETSSVSVPVFGVGNLIRGALTLSGPRDRFTSKEIHEMLGVLFQGAICITRELGGDHHSLSTASQNVIY